MRFFVIPPTMVAHTLSETEFYQWMNESLAKLESQFQTLLNEFRSIRTKWETPQTNIQSPPTSLPEPLPAPTATKSTNLIQHVATPPPQKVRSPAASTPKLFVALQQDPLQVTSGHCGSLGGIRQHQPPSPCFQPEIQDTNKNSLMADSCELKHVDDIWFGAPAMGKENSSFS
ncbi:hypothetical protein Hanom_Chr13g01214211 [Helianthus anomalus]